MLFVKTLTPGKSKSVLRRKRLIMLMYCVVQTKYVDGEENIPWRNTKEKQNFLQKKFLAKLYLLLMKYKVKLE